MYYQDHYAIAFLWWLHSSRFSAEQARRRMVGRECVLLPPSCPSTRPWMDRPQSRSSLHRLNLDTRVVVSNLWVGFVAASRTHGARMRRALVGLSRCAQS